jgi:hypothetical protein
MLKRIRGQVLKCEFAAPPSYCGPSGIPSKGPIWALEHATGISAAITSLDFFKSAEHYVHSQMVSRGVLISRLNNFAICLYFHKPHIAKTTTDKL